MSHTQRAPLPARVVSVIARHAPLWLVQAIGKRTGRYRILRSVDNLARASLAGEVVIPRGISAGLRYEASGDRPGFALGTWEPELQERLKELTEPGSVIWDVGAASGFFTIGMARLVGPNGAVVAFEPFPDNVERLRRNVELNGLENVVVVDKALSDHVGRGKLEPFASDEVTIVLKEGDPGDDSAVEVSTADALLNSLPIPSIVKSDIEGAEVEFLRGAKQLIGEHHPILVIEVHGRWDEIETALSELGYTYVGVEYERPSEADHPTHIVARPV